ncbi:MAG TPA: bifunctional 3,4-dihydroxy-2-butanone-4-phosphate synthase/GTP cyclohydrolase II [Verrucomicrobiae bacterium]|jgi:3,4-dihydroxy 2-butanone 4-phosphate synthase/GTP cyclohydrolase II|nr:bifunctional 3,4-dihydroxy-2-butanone-4-phosphate synthase/GTP cyclohydrolase II [Verrucomicrobiae bacterium]
MKFNTIPEIIEDIRQGRIVIMVDDEQRENEGDLIFAASQVTPEKVNFMIKHGRGLICVPLADEKIEALGLKEMTESLQDTFRTAFTTSVDARSGITTGISAFDRTRTIEALAEPQAGPADIVSPGHIFPLRAKKGGVLIRAGHTEAAVDLARLAGQTPAGVICEIISEDGKMARLPELFEFAKKHGLKIGTIQELIEHRRRFDRIVDKVSEATIPTVFGEWKIMLYRSLVDGREHVALVKGKMDDSPTLVRMHSECFTGDVLGSLRCDCQDQLMASMERIEKEDKGVIVYLRQEGRGIGLANKLKAYALQEKGMDTVEANEALGFKPDLREYGTGAQILKDLGLSKLRLMTNNPRKIVGLEGHGLHVVERVALQVEPNVYNAKYLMAKRQKLGHYFNQHS